MVRTHALEAIHLLVGLSLVDVVFAGHAVAVVASGGPIVLQGAFVGVHVRVDGVVVTQFALSVVLLVLSVRRRLGDVWQFVLSVPVQVSRIFGIGRKHAAGQFGHYLVVGLLRFEKLFEFFVLSVEVGGV